jgi:protoheme IX farnesyltransferase
VATSGAGYVLGSGNMVDIAGLCCTCAGTMMVAASANTLNQVFEIKNDAKMKRTMRRPLPSGRISPAHAAMWATSVGVAGTALLAWKVRTRSSLFICTCYVLF